MQKTNIKASILIWAMFLSLIITVTFVGISTKINKNLKNNASLTNKFQIENSVKNIINSGSLDGNFNNQYLENGDKIIFEKANKYITSLKKLETHTGKILANSNIYIKVIEGGPIYYKYNTSSGIINLNNTGNFNENSSNTGFFNIQNLGGYSKVIITSDSTKNHLSKYKKYEIVKQIGNNKIIKTNGKIKNF